ncbi:sulfatase-like hydrolase/transferase [Aurantiacibacter flavus]|uniref:Sulfatase-like hydrolase/transferase n=1 Tax=Aurantiacibacter flavus TaxID=3145232 RepID=A0ABV0CZ72_9SPHN
MIRDFPLRWLVYWLLLPNLAIMLMWFVGAPPMTPMFATFALVGLVAAQLKWPWVKRAILAGLILYTIYYYVLVLFNLGPDGLSMLWPFIVEVKPLRSPEYLLAALVLMVSCTIALYKAPSVKPFTSPMPFLLAIFAAMLVLAVDYWATESTRSTYRREAPAGAPVQAATYEAHLFQPKAGGHHLVVVIVEALGVPVGEQEKAIFAADWNRAAWRRRYAVEHGEIPFYGSTTSGELRELCQVRQSYDDVTEPMLGCLPARYRKAGYETHAYHGFTPSLFQRDRWYPLIGFDSFLFRDDLYGLGLSRCNGVFAGACDKQIPGLIAERLKAATKPQMVYFLTLNTHLPIMRDKSIETMECTLGDGSWAQDNPQLCRLFLMHHYLAEAIDALAMDPDLPPTDFLIVGDHFPPFFDRVDRNRFVPGVVPWVLLRHSDEDSS